MIWLSNRKYFYTATFFIDRAENITLISLLLNKAFIDGLVQNCGISSALAKDILLSVLH